MSRSRRKGRNRNDRNNRRRFMGTTYTYVDGVLVEQAQGEKREESRFDRQDRQLKKVGFKIPTVHYCPYTRMQRGVIKMPTDIVGKVLHTLYTERDKEWGVIFKGTRSPDGFEITVTGVRVPFDQERTGNDFFIDNIELEADDVLVGHSHHGMTARFSVEDYTHLNPRFPASVVISYNLHRAGVEEKLWGMSLSAEGKIKLPCGGIGIVEFKVVPIGEGAEDWPFPWEVVRRELRDEDFEKVELEDCNKWDVDGEREDKFSWGRTARCGLKETDIKAKVGIFASNDNEITRQLPPAKVPPKKEGKQKELLNETPAYSGKANGVEDSERS